MNSSEIKGYLKGLILGDASIHGGVTKRAMEIKSINRDFIDKIYRDLCKNTNFKVDVSQRKEYTDKDGVHHKTCYILRVKSHPYFAKKYHHFYDDNRRRIVSSEAMRWLTPEGLANWYMSDGYVCLVGKTHGEIRSRRVDISTDRYDRHTVERLAEMLTKRFSVHANVIKRQNRYRVRIHRDSYETFFSLIAPYMTPSMKYKMYLGYEKKPIDMSDDFWDFQDWLKSAITR